MTYRFLHAADLHLDAPLEGLGRTDPELTVRLRDASLQALDDLVEHAIRTRCQFVVLCGDIYDGLRRGARAQLRLRAAAERLDGEGVRLFLLHGNHDPIDEGYAAVHHWPDSTHFFAKDQAKAMAFETDAGPVTVTGRSYPTKRVPESLAASYPEPTGPGLHVALLHTQILTGAARHGRYSPCRVSDLVGTRFHYWALGHVHQRQILRQADPVVAYPGNTQGRHFGECGPKGALLVCGAPEALTTRFVPLARYVFERVCLDVDGRQDLDEVTSGLLDAVPDEGTAHLLLRAELTGRSPAYASIRTLEACEVLRRSLQDLSPPTVTWLDVRSQVGPDLDLDRLASDPTLAGSLLATVGDWSGEALRTAIAENRDLRRWLAAQTDEDLAALRTRALFRAVDAVHQEAAP